MHNRLQLKVFRISASRQGIRLIANNAGHSLKRLRPPAKPTV
jgi:hypothetical protein